MHTFFVNTSKMTLNNYEVLFDIHNENKSLVSLECPMAGWYDENRGYRSCVTTMGMLIDDYAELNNAFHLIVYIDLCENEAYSAIPRDAWHDKDRQECSRAMHILYTHAIRETLVAELAAEGRRPESVLILFGEEKEFLDFGASRAEPTEDGVVESFLRLLGLPEQGKTEELAKAIHAGTAKDKVGEFRQRVEALWSPELFPGARGGYEKELALWCEQVINEANVGRANAELFQRIEDQSHSPDRMNVEILSCPYDSYACRANKSIQALSRLNIALFLLRCLAAGSIYCQDPKTGKARLQPFCQYTVEEIAPLFEAKVDIFSRKAEDIETVEKTYAALGLAPRLRTFDNGKFGLDEHGDYAVKLTVSNAEPDSKDKKKKKSDDGLIKAPDKQVTAERKRLRPLFPSDRYRAFEDWYDPDNEAALSPKASARQYIARAMEVRQHHLDYLKRLHAHTTNVLSNYAAKSGFNKPALLRMGEYPYAGTGYSDAPLEDAQRVSERAYRSVLEQYMAFCAGRSVAITDIEEQCNWFVSQVEQISQSLRRLKAVALGLLVGLLALYIPFAVIQFEAITENMVAFSVALASLALPLVLLAVVFTAVAAAQRRRYRKVWKTFCQRSREALAANQEAVQKYDRLLSSVIPSLRWVYEYKLDVDYCADRCGIADAKLEHHRRKLRQRVRDIGNILKDLQYRGGDTGAAGKPTGLDTAIDYNEPYSSGDKNRAFYTVVNEAFFGESHE